jgi:hypothetical protein
MPPGVPETKRLEARCRNLGSADFHERGGLDASHVQLVQQRAESRPLVLNEGAKHQDFGRLLYI